MHTHVLQRNIHTHAHTHTHTYTFSRESYTHTPRETNIYIDSYIYTDSSMALAYDYRDKDNLLFESWRPWQVGGVGSSKG